MSGPTVRMVQGAAGLLLAVLLGACGDTAADTATDPTTAASADSTTSAEQLPDCGAVWVDGQDLPASYSGCAESGTEVPPVKHRCSSGQSIVEYADRFYAVPGNRVNDVGDLTASAQFKKAMKACQA